MRKRLGLVLALTGSIHGCDDAGPAAVEPVDRAVVDAVVMDMAVDAAVTPQDMRTRDMTLDASLDLAVEVMPDARAPDAEPDAEPDAAVIDMAVDMASDMALDADLEDMAVEPDMRPCVPSPETYDGLDDDCDGQIDELLGGEDLGSAIGIVARGSTRGAPQLAHGCGPLASPAARFTWTAPAAGLWRFDTAGSGFDTVLEIRTGLCDPAPACNDDRAPGDVRSRVDRALEAGDAVHILVAGADVDAAGDYLLSVREAVVPTPSYVGQAALDVLRADHAMDEGSTWNLTTDARFPVDWVLAVPEVEAWGLSAAEIEAAPAVPPDAAPEAAHPDLRLPRCAVDADCVVGTCRTVSATVEAVGQDPERLCLGRSDHVWDAMYRALVQARQFADVSSLDFPDNAAGVGEVVEGRFLIALRNALRYLHSTGEPVTVRFLFGWLVNDFEWDDRLAARVAALTDGVPEDTALRLYFGGLNYQLLSWNHSKIIAADGRALLQGGINFYSTDYLGAAPVQDLSMRVLGGPARDAHRYMNTIWSAFAEDYGDLVGDLDGTSTALVTVPPDLGPPRAIEIPAPAPGGFDGAPVLSLGRLGLIDRPGVDTPAPSDDAMWAAIAAARESLTFSLQDLGSVRDGVIVEVPVFGEIDLSYGWPERLMRILTDRMLDGVSVRIVISETGAGAYSYGWTKRDALLVWQGIIDADDALAARAIAAAGSVVDFLCDHVDFASVRIDGEADRWGDGSAMGNHSKFWIVDGRAVYIGSQNLYLSNLFEWGLLVDDAALTQQIERAWWDPLWAASRRSAVSGPSADGRCVLRAPPE